MKNYIFPEMDIVMLSAEDIITSSDNEIDLGGNGADFFA